MMSTPAAASLSACSFAPARGCNRYAVIAAHLDHRWWRHAECIDDHLDGMPEGDLKQFHSLFRARTGGGGIAASGSRMFACARDPVSLQQLIDKAL